MRRDPFRIFIGYDGREAVAYHVLASSILKRATVPVSITPLVQASLRRYGQYRRPYDEKASTEFAFTRFLVPALSNYEGYSLFMDCDMLCRVDIDMLLRNIMRPYDKAVWVCQHDYVPKSAVKFLGNEQVAYPRKNWSSFMLFNNSRCRALSIDYVNEASAADLHRFAWALDHHIGALPLEWNWLVEEYAPNDRAKVWHYTNGGPWFSGYANCDHADEWRQEFSEMIAPSCQPVGAQVGV